MGTLAVQLAPMFPETQRHYARCLKKLGYPSPADAEAVRERRQTQTDEILHVYGPCGDCGFWHLTHKPLTATQVLEIRDLLDAERARFETSYADLRRLARPYLKNHSMYKKSIQEMDEDFARQIDAFDRSKDYWMAMHQRDHALRLAQATTATEARVEDTQALTVLEDALLIWAKDREACLALREYYRTSAAQIFNQEYPLPVFDWRQHLGRGR